MVILLFLLLTVAVAVILIRLSGLSSRLDDAALEIKMLKGRLDQFEAAKPPAVPPAPSPAPSPAQAPAQPLPHPRAAITEMPTQIALPAPPPAPSKS
jgi:hypothetical protein